MSRVARQKNSAQGGYSERGVDTRLALGNCALAGLILLSCFAVIYSTHACRERYAQLQVLESSSWYLQEDYSRLLLEQSTWASHHRVEKVARGDLGMRAPDLERFKVVNK